MPRSSTQSPAYTGQMIRPRDTQPKPLASGFDYSWVPAEHRKKIAAEVLAIRAIVKRNAEGSIEIGRRLTVVRSLLTKLTFGAWLEAEFPWRRRTAYYYIKLAELFGELSCVSMFHQRALEILSQSTSPPEALAQAIKEAETGTFVSFKRAREILERPGYRPRHDRRQDLANVRRLVQAASIVSEISEELSDEQVAEAAEALTNCLVALRARGKGIDDSFWSTDGQKLMGVEQPIGGAA